MRLRSAWRAACADWCNKPKPEADRSAEAFHGVEIPMRVGRDDQGKDETYYERLRAFRTNEPVRREIREERQRLLADMAGLGFDDVYYTQRMAFKKGQIDNCNWILEIIHKIEPKKTTKREQNGRTEFTGRAGQPERRD